MRTHSNFVQIGNNVKIENMSDEQFGRNICNVLPHLIDSVEVKHMHKFLNMPTIYICNTNKSFCKYTGSKYPGPRVRTITNKGIFISPRLKDSKDWNEIIYHELSHVIIFEYLGTYHYITTPVWFHEGLATYISNGGGSGDVTDSAAIIEILRGNHFNPVANENILFPKSFNNDKIRPWMEYRQAMLFVNFLKEGKEKEFFKLLNNIFDKTSFSKSIEKSYGIKVPDLWNEFIEDLKKDKKQSAREETIASNANSQQPKQNFAVSEKTSISQDSLELFQKAELGDPYYQGLLGGFYLSGGLLKRNYDKAHTLLLLSSEKENPIGLSIWDGLKYLNINFNSVFQGNFLPCLYRIRNGR